MLRGFIMIGLELKNAVVIKQKEILEKALSTNPDTQKILQQLIRQVIMEARAKVAANIPFTHGDPRDARRAVRSSVYKQILGANINIYNSRKAHGSSNYEPPRTLRPGQVGGNRMKRSERTNRMMRYEGRDRGFVLRWLNTGTSTRKVASGGNRGSITAKNWFTSATNAQLVQAAEKLSKMIEAEFGKIMENN